MLILHVLPFVYKSYVSFKLRGKKKANKTREKKRGEEREHVQEERENIRGRKMQGRDNIKGENIKNFKYLIQ